MSDYNTMNAQQCSDWLIDREKWKYDAVLELWRRGDGYCSNDHPYKLTLDCAAAALREPWRLVQVDIWPGNSVARIVRDHCGSRKCVVGPDRLTAEYRAAVAARMEDDK